MTSLLMIGFLIGMRHALEADHVAAVASLAAKQQTLKQAMHQGMAWGLGHTITLFLMGSILLWMDTVVPESLARLLEFLVGAMLVLLGMLLKSADWHGKVKELVLVNGMRLLVSPAIAVLLAIPFGLSGVARSVGILEASMPAAVVTTVLATEFDVEPEFMTAVVFTTTILSPLTLTPILAFLAA